MATSGKTSLKNQELQVNMGITLEQNTESASQHSNSINSTEQVFGEDFEYMNSSCFICNGYYGPCFEEPVCATCHAFLFPEDMSHSEAIPISSEKEEKRETKILEPTDLYYGMERRQSQQPPPPPPPPQPPVAAPRPNYLTERLEMLSNPREPDDLTPGLVEYFFPNMLLAVFSYLDDMSLWSVGNVCKRWRHLLRTHVAGDQWRVYTMRRWPLFKPLCAVQDWFKVYTQLMNSCPCKTCLQQMALQTQPPGEENSWRRNRLRNELKNLRTDPPEGIEAAPLDQKCCHWQATITGPVGSPYEGGLFYLYLQVPYSYPMCPPIVRFLTHIFHPNVSRHGDVGIDSIQHNWSLALTISKVLISVQSLLTDPYCQVCMEPSVGELYMKDRSTFEDVARSWTWRYAMHDTLCPV
ncbi:hypothetical protein L9F63_022821 [Diploptera punctata]|uniref:E2 ubiquitin-conjugating enzyme n=1 Tax=Diploptera punctata TaxID=6984 RepID=A0AAD7ZM03_DIPPU|nr:hypothetical protein L9F63_022821 [Diploptera punctata]